MKRIRLEHGFMIDWGNGHKKYYLDGLYGMGISFEEWKVKVRKYYDTEEDYLLMLLKLD
jgi:hypothetical protein